MIFLRKTFSLAYHMTFLKLPKPIGWLFCLTFLIFLLYRILLIKTVQTDLGGIENAVVYFIQRSLAGISIYTDPELAPYSINQYGPLYYMLAHFAGSIAGTDPDDVLSVFMLNRTISLVLNILYVSVIILIASHIFSLGTRKSMAAAVICFIFLEITSFARTDSLNHFLFFLSIYFFLLWEKKRQVHTYLLVISALIAVAAIFTKQSSFTIPVLVGSWLLITKKNKDLLVFTLSCLLGTLIALIMIHVKWGLPVFFKNAVEGLNNGINAGLFWGNIIKPFFASFGLLFIPLAALVYHKLKKEHHFYLRFTAFALILQFSISALLSLKFGSHINYFTEFWTLLILGCAFYWDYANIKFKKSFPAFPLLFLSFILILKIGLISFPLYEELNNDQQTRKAYFDREKNLALRIKKNIEASPHQLVFNDLFSPHSYLNNLLYRSAIMPQYEIVFFTTYKRKVFDYSHFKNIFKTGQVAYIITRSAVEKPEFMDFSIENYKLVSDKDGYRVFAYEGTSYK